MRNDARQSVGSVGHLAHRLATVATMILIFAASIAGQEPAVKQEPAPKLRPAMNIDAANTFHPPLKSMLTAELYFAKKVCRPDEQQFDKLHRHGLDAIVELAIEYSELKRKRSRVEHWPAPREAVVEALEAGIKKHLPAEALAN